MDKNLLEIIEEHEDGIPEEDIKQYVYQLLKAVCFCHKLDVVH